MYENSCSTVRVGSSGLHPSSPYLLFASKTFGTRMHHLIRKTQLLLTTRAMLAQASVGFSATAQLLFVTHNFVHPKVCRQIGVGMSIYVQIDWCQHLRQRDVSQSIN